MAPIDADQHPDLFVPHGYTEQRVDLGEVRINYATAGDPSLPALLMIPAQSESWWGYEQAMGLLSDRFQMYAVDLRGQGRSTWTPGRYTLDLFGGDMVRFIDEVIGRPTIVSGLSSGGVVSAWLSAYAKPDQVRAALYEDPPLFASEVNPAVGHSIRQSIGGLFSLWNTYLGDQWSLGNWDAMQKALPQNLPLSTLIGIGRMFPPVPGAPEQEGIPQNFKEYDPEWGKAFASGAASASCDHARMLASVKVPVLLTHHYRAVDEPSDTLTGALSDVQARRAGEIISGAGQDFSYLSFPDMPHGMHMYQPQTYADTLVDWASRLGLLE